MICKEIIEEIYYPHKFNTSSSKWLNGMELLFYNDELKLAVEYHGIEHYNCCDLDNMMDFYNQIRRDNLKLDICDEHEVYVITVPYNVKKDEIKSFIIRYLLRIASDNYEGFNY